MLDELQQYNEIINDPNEDKEMKKMAKDDYNAIIERIDEF